MQQQQQNAEDERIARERFEDRQRKNQQQFNEMLLKYLWTIKELESNKKKL